jgi:hypothetical protein
MKVYILGCTKDLVNRNDLGIFLLINHLVKLYYIMSFYSYLWIIIIALYLPFIYHLAYPYLE